MTNSQVHVALTNLGASVRADFHHMRVAWQSDWLFPVSVSHSDWLATDHLLAEVGYIQAPLDNLLDLQRFLTAGFLPTVDIPREEPASVATADRAYAASKLAAPGRAMGATQPPALDQATYPHPLLSLTDTQRDGPTRMDTQSPAVSTPNEPPQRPPTTGQLRTTLAGTSTPSSDVGLPGMPIPDSMYGSGLHVPMQQWSPETPAQQQMVEPIATDDPTSWTAYPPRVGGLRDLAQRLSTDAHWSAPPVDRLIVPTTGQEQTPLQVAQAQRGDASMSAASVSSAAPPLHSATTLPAAPGREDHVAALSPVVLPTSTASMAYMLHGQSGQSHAPTPLTTLPAVHATLPQMDTLMDALAREITREYHRFYGA